MRVAHANRGKGLELLLEFANAQYMHQGIANIEKVATPWKVRRRGKDIVSAFPEKKSTVDYMGDCRGRSIAFEAKSCEEEDRFPLNNIEDHQVDFLRRWRGYKFLIIEWVKYRKIFFVPWDKFIDAWNYQDTGRRGSKSIPYEWFSEHCQEIKQDRVILDYLQHVEVPNESSRSV